MPKSTTIPGDPCSLSAAATVQIPPIAYQTPTSRSIPSWMELNALRRGGGDDREGGTATSGGATGGGGVTDEGP